MTTRLVTKYTWRLLTKEDLLTKLIVRLDWNNITYFDDTFVSEDEAIEALKEFYKTNDKDVCVHPALVLIKVHGFDY